MKIKAYNELQFTDDFMFNKVMQNESICKRVIETLLGIKVGKLVYKENQKTLDYSYTGKGIRLDVYVEDSSRIVDVEMQTSIQFDLGLRIRYYQSIIDIHNLEKGSSYSDLKDSIICFICTSDPFDKELPVYTFTNMCHEDNTVDLKDNALKVLYNVSEYDKITEVQKYNLLKYIATAKNSDVLTKEIDNAVEAARMNEPWSIEYMQYNEKMNAAKNDGRAEIIRTFLESMSIEDIAQKLHMTVEEVDKLVNN